MLHPYQVTGVFKRDVCFTSLHIPTVGIIKQQNTL